MHILLRNLGISSDPRRCQNYYLLKLYDTSLQFVHTQAIQSHIHANIRYPKSIRNPKSESIRRMGKQSDIRKYPNPKVIRIRLLRMGKQSHEVRSGGVYFLQSTSFSS